MFLKSAESNINSAEPTHLRSMTFTSAWPFGRYFTCLQISHPGLPSAVLCSWKPLMVHFEMVLIYSSFTRSDWKPGLATMGLYTIAIASFS